jgi:hypothetical protein
LEEDLTKQLQLKGTITQLTAGEINISEPLNNKDNQRAEITTYLSILRLNVSGLNFLSKDITLKIGLKRKIQQSVVYRRLISLTETNTGLGKRLEEDLPRQWPPKTGRSRIYISR